MPRCFLRWLPVLLIVFVSRGFAQQDASPISAGQLDPTRSVAHPQLFSSFHTPLEEQYIWTREDSAVGNRAKINYRSPGLHHNTAPHYFRVAFQLDHVPAEATFYLAGPRSATIYVNGVLVERISSDFLNPLGIHVFRLDVARLLKPGRNVIALEAVCGRGVPGFVNSALAMQQIFGEVLVAKLIPAAGGVDAPPILVSSPDWKGTLHSSAGWEQPSFDDSAWPAVAPLSPIEGSIDLFQWNADAGLYDWPGYEGASQFLAHMFLPAAHVEDVVTGRSEFENLDALTTPEGSAEKEFAVKLGSTAPGEEYAPAITLDFGREVTGRVELISDMDTEAVVSIQYGESEGELDHGPYLGVNDLRLAAHQAGHGPKSAFRYARIRFLSGPPELRFKAIRLEDIYYPVHYQGSFESSDPLLNRIWETGAYTVHLCMQDDIWDAPKRDRGRWMGDTDVSGRVSDTVFFDRFLLKDTLSRLIGEPLVAQHVNGIPGYSSFWFTALEDYVRHTGDLAYLEQVRPQLLQLLQFMDKEFDAQNEFANRTKAWLFVDWAPDLNGDTDEARQATVIEYYRAYLAGADLLRQLGDATDAEHFEARAAELKKSVQATVWSPAEGDFGPRWQTNAMAVLSGVADPSEYGAIWTHVLAQVGEPTFRPNLITPYYGAYVLDAMAKINRRADAMKWIREYWGGMIDEGATSFWEAYDPSWPKNNPHSDLQADGTTGYFASLAHGWSAGPTYWLMEQVLGIRPVAEGFSKTIIRPDLIDLKWARGQEPTPHGLLTIDLRDENGLHTAIDLPEGVHATVLFPVARGATSVIVNGLARQGEPAENGTRLAITLDSPGHFEIHAR
jgi:alpha-L-rhamnosidase